MERAHVLIRLRGAVEGDDQHSPDHRQQQQPSDVDGVTRTSATSVRLEHSAMSPGVASISFERVADVQDAARLFDESLAPAAARCAAGFAASLVVTGAPRSGKSFACHGDRPQRITGLMTLSLRHIFKELERLRDADATLEHQVLLGCFHVDASEQLVDLMRTPAAPVAAASPLVRAEQLLLQRSVRVANSAEAVHCYSQALAASARATGGKSHFALVVHVESKRAGEERVRRGRLVCVDIHGSSILEPTTNRCSAHDVALEKPVFSDTHFPVATGLSKWFGGFVGNESATYILVTIHKQALFQQQAIQSLLYACKAKDIKSSCSIAYVPVFTAASAPAPARANEADHEDDSSNQFDGTGDKQLDDAFPGSPVSTTSSHSTDDFAIASNDTIRAPPVDARSPYASEKQSLISQRLRQAYQSVKSSAGVGDPLNSLLTPTKLHHDTLETGGPGNQSHREKHERFEGLFATKANFLHAKADAMLRPRANELQALSLLDKLELIRVQYQEVEKALAHETSIKEKCVDRISKLSQTVSFQVVEHEKQMQQALAEKQRVQAQLSAMALKFEGVSNEVEQLQREVGLVKASRTTTEAQAPAWSPSDAGSERALLQQFSSRLERAMEEARGVVAFKDGAIRDLERRCQEAEQASARVSEELAHQTHLHEQETATQLQQLSDLRVQIRSGNDAAAREAARFESERAALRTQVSELLSEVEGLRARPVAWEHEHAGTQTDSCVDDAAAKLQALEERVARTTGECAAAHAASLASRRRAELLEARVAEAALKLERTRKKVEKKAKALRSAASQHALALAQQRDEFERREQRRERELASLRGAIRQHEGTSAELTAEIEQLQDANRRLDCQCAELQQRVGASAASRQAVEAKCQQQICSLEQSLARRMLEREAHLAAEHDRKMRTVMDRHASELLARELDDEPASLSTLGSSAGLSDAETGGSPPPPPLRRQPQQQQSIDQLDALIDLKEKQYAKAAPRQKPSSSARQLSELERRLGELTQALAVANEQETLAKQHSQRVADAHHASVQQREQLLEELNRLKQENWSLSLALQVTERR